MEAGICFIVGAGDFQEKSIPVETDDYVIAADGGFLNLKGLGIHPDMVVGDFDSMEVVPEHNNIIRHPVEKDDTDMLLAVKQGLSMGYRRFVIFGGLGGRLDHTIANLQVLAYIAEAGGKGFLMSGEESVTVIRNSKISFSEDSKGTVSVFCVGDRAKGVYLEGLRYPLNNATLTKDFPIGVSNEFTGEPAAVTVEEGMLAIIWNEPFHRGLVEA